MRNSPLRVIETLSQNAITKLGLTRSVIGAGAGLTGAVMIAASLLNGPQTNVQAAVPGPQEIAVSHDDIFTDFAAAPGLGDRAKTVTLKSGDSLGPLLQKNGVDGQTAYRVTQAFSKVYSPRDLRAGQTINMYLDDNDALFGISLKPGLERTLYVTRATDGGFSAKDLEITFPKELVQVAGIIENSLYLDAARKGVPDKVTVQFSHIYEHSVDFQRDIQPGDAFTMAFELYRDAKGNPLKAGDLLYTSFSPRGKTAEYYLYANKKGHENYYDQNGKGAKRKLMRTPINGARLSSGFGKRRHPISGYRKNHNGVDFAAPKGTPIMAAGVGIVERANRWSTFGNYVRIHHSDGYKTAYAHLNGFARGIKKGTRVRQGQIIGYVGTTGASTGNHLHYEVHKNGRPINPKTLSTLSGKPLPKAERADFTKRRKQIDALRKNAPPAIMPTPVSTAALTSESAP